MRARLTVSCAARLLRVVVAHVFQLVRVVLAGCTSRFALKGALKVHHRTHTGERPFPCSYPGCTSSFQTKSHLVRHAKGHGRRSPRSPSTRTGDAGTPSPAPSPQ